MSYSHLSPLFFNWISRNHSLSIHISSQLWMLKNAINISDCIYSKFLRLYLFQVIQLATRVLLIVKSNPIKIKIKNLSLKNIDIKKVRAHYSKRDIESWQLTGCRSSYKYISRSMDPVIGQLPSNSIFMEQDHRPKSDLLWQSTRDLFFIYIYISSSLFSLFHAFLVSISSSISTIRPCFHGGAWFVAADTGPMVRFSTFPESPPRC